MLSPLVEQLINALRCLPGVGPKTAQRMALQLLLHKRNNGLNLARVLQQTLTTVNYCHECNNLSELPICQLCANPHRNQSLLCIAGSPLDVIAFEQAGNFNGLYFILKGQLSPLEGIGPQEIGIEKLLTRLDNRPIQEVILATNTTVEGEATANYIATLIEKMHIKCSRIGFGVPFGGELDYLDRNTLARALANRTLINTS